LAAYVIRELQQLGYQPALISRGYGRSSKDRTVLVSDGQSIDVDVQTAGDEPLMLARQSPGAVVVVGPRRWKAGRWVETHLPSASRVFVLDDGFQHLSLARDVDIVTVDATVRRLVTRLLPAGPGREPAGSLQRADAVCLTRCHLAPDSAAEREREIQALAPGMPVFRFSSLPWGLRDLRSGTLGPLDAVVGRKVVALAALGNPGQFLQDLARSGCKVINEFIFPDHHPFTQAELDLIRRRAQTLGVDTVITTEKDAVRIEGLDPGGLEILAFCIRFETPGRAEFREWLGTRIEQARAGRMTGNGVGFGEDAGKTEGCHGE